jgi:spore photoproduct lyase
MSKLIETLTRKSMEIKFSGRSSDYITPSFGFGCVLECAYCYMKRHKPKGLTVAENYNDILTAVNNHAYFYADVEKPNQTDPEFITYDLACNEDFVAHAKYHQWEKIFAFFRDHPIAKATLATKYVNKELLKFDPHEKVRIRFSLMPEEYRQVLEPNTNTIYERLIAVEKFIDAGYEVHLNFSPVIVHDNWLDKYKELFEVVQYNARTYAWDTDAVKSEVIFLTHNSQKHVYNLEHEIPGEDLLWRPDIQEHKISSYGSINLRYRHDLKANFIEEFKSLHAEIIPWNTIRYIF